MILYIPQFIVLASSYKENRFLPLVYVTYRLFSIRSKEDRNYIEDS